MIFLIVGSAAFTAGNIVLRIKKKEKVKLDAKEMFAEHGYHLNDDVANKLMRIFIGQNNQEALDSAIENYVELVAQFIPGMNVFYVIQNTLYLNGKKSTQDFYNNYTNWDLYDRTLPDGIKPLDVLERMGLEKVYGIDVEKNINTNKICAKNSMYSNYSNTFEENDEKIYSLSYVPPKK